MASAALLSTRSKKEALFLFTIDNQSLTRELSFEESKGSGIVGSSSEKIRIENRKIPHVSMAKATRRKSQHYVECWPIQRGVSEEAAWGEGDFLMERSKIVSRIFGHASFAIKGNHAPSFALKLKFKLPPAVPHVALPRNSAGSSPPPSLPLSLLFGQNLYKSLKKTTFSLQR